MKHAQCYANWTKAEQKSMCRLYQLPLLSLHLETTKPRLPVWKRRSDSAVRGQSGVTSIPVSTYCAPIPASTTCCAEQAFRNPADL